MQNKKTPSFILAFLPIIVLIFFLAINISIWEDESLGGPNQLALIIATFVAGLVAYKYAYTFDRMLKYIVKNISDAMPSILILLLIGALSGTWMISGVVPMLIVYGLEILNTDIFLFATVIISAIIALSTGSSWSTIATIGVALLGIGTALGFPPSMTAGAVISGAYFGDKLSPLSDTTNLAPAMAGTDLFTHIRYMLYTTAPTLVITLVIFLVLGFNHEDVSNPNEIEALINAIESTFVITPWLLLVPALLIFLILKKISPIVALFIGALAATIAALIFQTQLITDTYNQLNLGNNDAYFIQAYVVNATAWFGSSSVLTDNESVNSLLSTGGMAGMLETVWLIVIAMAFSGVMESAGLLNRIASTIIHKAKSTGSLVATTVATSIFMNITASEQYISVVVPGRMFANVYRNRKLKPEVLSRALEDGGTVTSVLVPWNTCGAVNSTVLGVSTFAYLPYAFFNLISPLMSILIAYLDFKIRRYSDEEYEVMISIDKDLTTGGV